MPCVAFRPSWDRYCRPHGRAPPPDFDRSRKKPTGWCDRRLNSGDRDGPLARGALLACLQGNASHMYRRSHAKRPRPSRRSFPSSGGRSSTRSRHRQHIMHHGRIVINRLRVGCSLLTQERPLSLSCFFTHRRPLLAPTTHPPWRLRPPPTCCTPPSVSSQPAMLVLGWPGLLKLKL